MLSNSICVGVRTLETKLIGFTHAITDGIFKAIIVDVVVTPPHRNHGVCAMLMDGILSHRDLSEVEDFELYCQPDLIPLYSK